MANINFEAVNSKRGTKIARTKGVLVRTGATLLVAVCALVTVQIGATALTNRAEAVPSPDPSPLIPVSVFELAGQWFHPGHPRGPGTTVPSGGAPGGGTVPSLLPGG